MRDITMPIGLEDIILPDGRRPLKADAVKRLAESIEEIGLKHPITVRRKGDEKYILVAGLHRLEAFRKLGKESIPATICSFNKDEARLWEIAENLHRADLTVQERSDQTAEWIRITEDRERREVSAQVGQKSHGRPEGGISAASRELGITRQEAQRAVKIASLSDEAKQAAEDLGLDNNQSALLEAARHSTPEAQIVALRTPRQRPVSPAPEVLNDIESKEKWMTAGMNWWNRGSKEWRDDFLQRVDVDGGIPEFLRRA